MSPTTRKIGSTDVSALGYGCMGLSGFYGPVKPDEERLQVCNFAVMYKYSSSAEPGPLFHRSSTPPTRRASASGTRRISTATARTSLANGALHPALSFYRPR